MPPLMSCDEVRSEINQRTINRVTLLRARPLVRIWDKNWDNGTGAWKPMAIIRAEIDGDFEDILNNAGPGRLRLLSSHPLYEWLFEELEEEEDVHITVDTPGWRWHGKAAKISEIQDEDGFEYIELQFLHGLEHAKKVVCFANPFLPAILQWPKVWSWAGPSRTGILTLLFLNLLRRYAPLWQLPDNIFDPQSWLENLNPANWPQVVNPRGLGLADTSMWTVLTSRFGTFHDVVTPTLEDAGLQLIATRWLPGDPQPCPEFFILTRPTLVWSCEDKSGVRGPTGTSLDGLLRLVGSVAQDGINEIVESVAVGQAPPEYGQPGWYGTITDWPWVSWRNNMRYAKEGRTGIKGIRSWERHVHKALAGAVVTGGRSPGWINSGVKLILNAALGYLGMLFGNPALGLGIFDKQVEDVILAFQRVSNPIRQALMGRDSYGEHWEQSGSNGLSLSTLKAIRMGMWNTRAYTSYRVKVINGMPYWVGRHFGLGDRVAAAIGRTRKLYVDQVHSLRYSWSRTKDPAFEIAIGTDKEEAPPTSRLGRLMEQARGFMQMNGVDV